jgi:putative iron-regulated protein
MSKLAAFLIAFALPAAHADNAAVINAYANKVYAQYSEALAGAQNLKAAIDQFLAAPNEANLAVARTAWLVSRESYSPTEVYRFYSGPIDNEAAEGPEGSLNAWPLDEAYIDYVEGDLSAGFIQKPDLYPSLNADVLAELNEKDGEKNIATGYHAIEFMLWGQDRFDDSAGRRPASDYTTAAYADRRKAYLQSVTEILIADLTFLVESWTPGTKDNFYAEFTAPERETESLTNILTGVAQLSGFELIQERMFTALDNRDQEDEHSCFSDNTHNDFIYNFKGIKTVLEGGVIDLVRAQDEGVADELVAAIGSTEAALNAIPVPFDQAITDDAKRPIVMKAVAALEGLAEATRQAAVTLGLELPQE